MTSYPRTRRAGDVTRRVQNDAGTTGHHGSASARSARRRARGSVAFGAAVLVATALVAGAGGAGAAGLLTGRNVRDDSLRSADFRDGSIRAGRIRNGTLHPADVGFDLTGDPGAPGNQGPPGFPGIQKITLRTGLPVASDIDDLNAIAPCAADEIALAGGAQLDSAGPGVLPYIVSSSRASVDSWQTVISSSFIGAKKYTPWVVCAQVP
jgi:hypothetical protein